MSEEWRPVVGFDGYEVSSRGRVRSINRTIPHGVVGKLRRVKGRILKPARLKNGYLAVALSIGGSHTTASIHRLVACAFLGRPVAGSVVNHLDGDPRNNQAVNLEWTTYRGNLIHAAKNGRLGKVKSYHVMEIRQRCAAGESQYALASEFGVDQTQISNIHLRKSWGHL